MYRDALRGLLANLSKPTPASVREAFQDVVQPEINKIDKAIADSRRLLRGSMLQDLIGAAVIGVGYFAGFLPPDINNILAAIGGTKFVGGIVQKGVQQIQEPAPVVENKYYFLWKVKQRARARRPRIVIKPRGRVIRIRPSPAGGAQPRARRRDQSG